AGDLTRAARLLGASEAVSEAMGQACSPVGRPEYERTVAAIQERLQPAEHGSARAAGRAMTLDQAIADALDGYNGEGPGQLEDQRRTHLPRGVGLRGTLAGE
ncbi:MAG: hypothetical protein M3121_01370, partial [Chloroflexota bacterium]|nr:hypothetical protein [Chloroflexota bacterium]